eukprot:COSAG01_NODE_2661_length_7295_cov_10.017371_2_plen_64_part_00
MLGQIVLDPVYGAYTLTHRFNVDQVPLPFVVEKNKTIDDKGVSAVQINKKGRGNLSTKRSRSQ